MNRAKERRLATALAIVASAALAGCGSSKSPVPPVGAPFPGQPLPGGYGACIPLTNGQLGFSATGIYWDGRNLHAGLIPGYTQTFGQVVVGAGGAGGPY